MSTRNLEASSLPDFSALRAQVDWDYTLSNYIESRGSFELAIAFADLYWPEFIQRRDCIVRSEGLTDDLFEQWWERTSGDQTAVERVLNALHVADLIPSEQSVVALEVTQHLAKGISEMWFQRATSLFPSRRFRAWIEDTDESGARVNPTVFITQQR